MSRMKRTSEIQMGSSNIAETILRIEGCLLLGLVIKICEKNRLKNRIEKPLKSSKPDRVWTKKMPYLVFIVSGKVNTMSRK